MPNDPCLWRTVAESEGGNQMSKERKRMIVIFALCLVVLISAIVVAIFLTLDTNGAKQPDAQIHADKTPNGQENTPDDQNQADTNEPEKDDQQKPHEEENNKPEEDETLNQDTPQNNQQKPNGEEEEEEDEKDEEDEEEITPPPEQVPPVVDIPSKDETVGLEFPCEVPGHNLRIEKLAPYSGLFVEDGTNVQVANVAMLLICNYGDSAIEYTEIIVEYQDKTLAFQITALPAGERMVVQEKSGNSIPEGIAKSATAMVVHRAQMNIAPELSVTDNGDNSLTVKNLTEETIPALRVFYKYYMEDDDLFVGGIAFTVRITGLGPNGSVVVHPAHYNSQTSRVVMALTYDTDI